MDTILLTVTLVSLGVAIAATALAWRVLREERLRSDARVAALAAELDAEGGVRPDPPTAIGADPDPHPVVTGRDGLFADQRRERAGLSPAVWAALGAVVLVVVVGALVAIGRPEQTAPAAGATAAEPAALPLELVALGHEREDDRLVVRGVIREPGDGAGPGGLTAVVVVFTNDGGFVASGRAEVGEPRGAERTFVVTVPAAGPVGRYRVSFRSDDRVVPHVDRRAAASRPQSEA